MVSVLVALCSVVLFGFVALAVDVARVYAERSELQRTADVSALSGASAMAEAPGAALPEARRYLRDNPTQYLSEGASTVSLASCAEGACVTSRAVAPDFPFLFAGVLGFESREISAQAKAVAAAGAAGGLKLLPWGVLACGAGPSPAGSCGYALATSWSGPRTLLSFGDTSAPPQEPGGPARSTGNLVAVGVRAGTDCRTTAGSPASAPGYFAALRGGRSLCYVGSGTQLKTLQPEVIADGTPAALGSRVRGCLTQASFQRAVYLDNGFARVNDIDNGCLAAVVLVRLAAGGIAGEPPSRVIATGSALFYVTRIGPDNTYEGLLMRGLLTASADDDGRPCLTSDFLCVAKLIE